MKNVFAFAFLLISLSCFGQFPDALKSDTVVVISYMEMPLAPGKGLFVKMANASMKSHNKRVPKLNRFQEKCMSKYKFPYKYISPVDLENKEKVGGARFILRWNVEYEERSYYNSKTRFMETKTVDFYTYYLHDLISGTNYEIPGIKRAASQAAAFKKAIKQINEHFGIEA